MTTNYPMATTSGNGLGYTGRILMAAGCELRERVTRVAYARNGNAHRPTLSVAWDVFKAGRLIATARLLRDAKAIAAEVV